MADHASTEAATTATSSTGTVLDARIPRIAGAVLALHLVTSALHGVTHAGTGVTLGPAFDGIVAVVVYGLPVLGFVLLWRGAVRRGAAVFTFGLAASLALGGAFHFLLDTPDHVANVPPGRWQLPFHLTTVAIAIADAAGTLVGAALWWATTGPREDRPGSARIDGVPGTGFRPLTRLVYWGSRRWFDAVPQSLTVTAHHGGVLAGASAFEIGLASGDAVDDRLTALAVEKAAMEIGCPFCIDIGAAEAAKHGITDEQLGALPAFEDSDAFSDVERLVLRYAVAVTGTPTEVPDELFDELAATFDERQLVELTAAIAWENYRGRFNHAFGMDSQGFAAVES